MKAGTTDIRRVMDRVARHPMMRDVPFETAVEWAVDFIELMGTPALYDDRTAVVEVRGWRGELPCDFHRMVQARLLDKCGRPVPGGALRASGDSFHLSPAKGPGPKGLTYKLQGRVMFTSVEDADVEVAYRAFAVDGEGLPLLPDDASFLRGLEAYVKVQWFTVLFDLGRIPLAALQNAQQEYAWAAGDAQSQGSRLSPDEAETLFNSFKSLLPRTHAHRDGFANDGAREAWRRHGNSR